MVWRISGGGKIMKQPELDQYGNIIDLEFDESLRIKPTDAIQTIIRKQERQYYMWGKKIAEDGGI